MSVFIVIIRARDFEYEVEDEIFDVCSTREKAEASITEAYKSGWSMKYCQFFIREWPVD